MTKQQVAPAGAYKFARELAGLGYGRPTIRRLTKERFGMAPRTDTVSALIKRVRAGKHFPFPTRQREFVYKRLIRQGFTDFEADEMSEKFSPFGVTQQEMPYLRTMIQDRRRILRRVLRQSAKQGLLKEQIKDLFEAKVTSLYRKHGWKSVWDMVRWYEERFKDRHPDWESPRSKGKRRKDFLEPVSVLVTRQEPTYISPEVRELKERQKRMQDEAFGYIRRAREESK